MNAINNTSNQRTIAIVKERLGLLSTLALSGVAFTTQRRTKNKRTLPVIFSTCAKTHAQVKGVELLLFPLPKALHSHRSTANADASILSSFLFQRSDVLCGTFQSSSYPSDLGVFSRVVLSFSGVLKP